MVIWQFLHLQEVLRKALVGWRKWARAYAKMHARAIIALECSHGKVVIRELNDRGNTWIALFVFVSVGSTRTLAAEMFEVPAASDVKLADLRRLQSVVILQSV